MSEAPPARPAVVIIGGGYGGINVARQLDDVASVVLVEPEDAFVHNVAALRALVAPAWLPRIYLPYGGLLSHGRVVRDRGRSCAGSSPGWACRSCWAARCGVRLGETAGNAAEAAGNPAGESPPEE
jgi:glycine/D-amino acid oxidase-like deaminating enzyme